MGDILIPLISVISLALDLFIWCLLISVVISWLLAFGILNQHSRPVYLVISTLHRLTDPVLRPIRQILPNFGALDLSPIVVILLIYFLQGVLQNLAIRIAHGG